MDEELLLAFKIPLFLLQDFLFPTKSPVFLQWSQNFSYLYSMRRINIRSICLPLCLRSAYDEKPNPLTCMLEIESGSFHVISSVLPPPLDWRDMFIWYWIKSLPHTQDPSRGYLSEQGHNILNVSRSSKSEPKLVLSIFICFLSTRGKEGEAV